MPGGRRGSSTTEYRSRSRSALTIAFIERWVWDSAMSPCPFARDFSPRLHKITAKGHPLPTFQSHHRVPNQCVSFGRVIRMSTKYPLFVSKWSQARITIRRVNSRSALSLLAGSRAREASRVDTGYARSRGMFRVALWLEAQSRVQKSKCGSTTALKEGREFRRDENPSPNGGRCGATCLTLNSDDEEIEACLNSRPERSAEGELRLAWMDRRKQRGAAFAVTMQNH